MKTGLLLWVAFACSGENPGVVDTLVDDACCRGNHISTRPHNRKVVYHAPTSSWFVFHGTGGGWHEKLGDAGFEREMIGWRHSRDGLAFSKLRPAVVGNGHSSSADTLLVGNRIYELGFRRTYWRRKAGLPEFINGKLWAHRDNVKSDGPAFHAPYEVFPFDIAGDRLVGRKEGEALPGGSHIGAEGPHYGSLTRDTKGYIWVAGRAHAGVDERYATWVARSKRPDDISEWERHTVLFTSGVAGTHAPQVMALDEGRVACVLFVKPERMTMVFVYDPGSGAWAKPHILEVSAVADFSHGLGFLYWCQWKDPAVRKQKDDIGQLRFGLVKDVAALFAGS